MKPHERAAAERRARAALNRALAGGGGGVFRFGVGHGVGYGPTAGNRAAAPAAPQIAGQPCASAVEHVIDAEFVDVGPTGQQPGWSGHADGSSNQHGPACARSGRKTWPTSWLLALVMTGAAIECAIANVFGGPAPLETLWVDALVIFALWRIGSKAR